MYFLACGTLATGADEEYSAIPPGGSADGADRAVISVPCVVNPSILKMTSRTLASFAVQTTVRHVAQAAHQSCSIE